MLAECNLDKNIVYNMKSGQMPSAVKMVTIADYLGVATEYLMGITDDPTPPKKTLTLDEQVAAEYYKMSAEEREQLKEYMTFLKIRKNLKTNLTNGSTEISSELKPQ